MWPAAPVLVAHVALALSWAGLMVRWHRGLAGDDPAGLRRIQREGWLAGLAMGGLIAAGLLARHLVRGELRWPPGEAATWRSLAFLPLWVSAFHLEIWTLEPARRAWARGEEPDRALAARVRRRLALQLALALAVGGLCTVSAAAWPAAARLAPSP